MSEFIDQRKVLLDLMKIECKVDEKGCDGPWCQARAAIAEAFDLESELPKTSTNKKET